MHGTQSGFCGLLICCLLMSMLSSAGCSNLPHSTKSGDIQRINIDETVTPREVYAAAGDEVRWINNRDTPVRIGFLGKTELKGISCEKGFQHLWVIQDIVIIPPHDYVSLCFSQKGKIRYNVWWDLDDPRGGISRTATIHVSQGHVMPPPPWRSFQF